MANDPVPPPAAPPRARRSFPRPPGEALWVIGTLVVIALIAAPPWWW